MSTNALTCAQKSTPYDFSISLFFKVVKGVWKYKKKRVFCKHYYEKSYIFMNAEVT